MSILARRRGVNGEMDSQKNDLKVVEVESCFAVSIAICTCLAV